MTPAEPEDLATLNATPLIDVLLVLLVMLMMAIPPTLHTVDLSATRALDTSPEPPDDRINLCIGRTGTVTWNGQSLDGLADLEQRLASTLTTPAGPDIRVHVASNTPYGLVLPVLDRARQRGLSSLSLEIGDPVTGPGAAAFCP
ncbi:biopolymer transporter ExbD [Phaeovibrio sulfidiphilus]|uniref:Biopolymer transporter ExbD n=1 Tax=Phaeovibrio sulfidiphilus TaxID=1220600 RepID=A0A8J7CQZ8_9PROT|nr:biopolymer transporter ExbD [Phaeovibrio sulfidiphilus]MBE1237365.1 biopolymer transporter ExbD [Phaeovibrio sulfidiphilus]